MAVGMGKKSVSFGGKTNLRPGVMAHLVEKAKKEPIRRTMSSS